MSVFNSDGDLHELVQYLMDKNASLEKRDKEHLGKIKSLTEIDERLEDKLQKASMTIIEHADMMMQYTESGAKLSRENIWRDINSAVLEYVHSKERDVQRITDERDQALAENKELQDKVKNLTKRDEYHDSGSTTSGQPTITKMQEQAERDAKSADKEPKKPGAPVGTPGSSRNWNFESVEYLRLSICPECNAALTQLSSYNKGMLRLKSNRIHEIMYVVYKYVCKNGHVISSKPDWMVDGTSLDSALLAKVARFRKNNSSYTGVCEDLNIAWNDCTVSKATVIRAIRAIAPKLLQEYNRIGEKLSKADSAGVDETTCRIQNHRRGQIWCFTFRSGTEKGVYFQAALSRSRKVLRNIIPPTVPATTDRYSVYPKYFEICQACWSHVKIKVKNGILKNKTPESEYLYGRLMDIFKHVKTLPPDTPKDEIARIVSKIKLIGKNLLDVGIKAGTYVINCADDLLTAVSHPELDLTNNVTERALRPFVLMRHVIRRFDTLRGAQEHCVLATCLDTWKLQNKKPEFEIRRLLAS